MRSRIKSRFSKSRNVNSSYVKIGCGIVVAICYETSWQFSKGVGRSRMKDFKETKTLWKEVKGNVLNRLDTATLGTALNISSSSTSSSSISSSQSKSGLSERGRHIISLG